VHRSSWKEKSANFALTEFYEVHSQKYPPGRCAYSQMPATVMALYNPAGPIAPPLFLVLFTEKGPTR
jgi:hypothetical protein